MIIKGKSRGGPRQLATHLLRTDTNEIVKIIQIDSPTGDLREALRDWQFISTGTQGTRGLYHAQINPDARYVMTPEQWKRTVDVLEQELKLDGQPRAVVLHEKEGRQHIHVVWQRTDIDTMKMVHDGFNYVAHEKASMALEKEFGHEHVPGKHAKRDREKQPEMPKAEISHAEWQQGERSGIDPREFKETITAIYKSCDNAQAFRAALDERGLIIAKGDQRPTVIVDELGQVYSLSRQIKDVPRKEVNAFLAGFDPASLPTIEKAQAIQEERARTQEKTPEVSPDAALQPTNPAKEETAALEQALRERHAKEANELRLRQETEYKQTARILEEDSKEKLADFDALQQAARERYFRETYRAKTGLAAFVEVVKERLNPQQAAEDTRGRKEAADAFLHKQEKEREERVAGLRAAQNADLGDLAERHQQQQREHSARFDEDRGRYLREFDAAAKLLADIEERRRQEELRAEREKNRNGPAPPERAR